MLMARPKILVTKPWPKPVEQYLLDRYDVKLNETGAAMSHAELVQAMSDYDCVCSSLGDPMDATVFNVPNARARMIGHYGAGYDNIDVAAAKAAGITVSNTPDVLTDATADIALMLMLMASRRASEGERQLRAGKWGGWGTTSLMGQSLEGKTLGLVGFGRIAQATGLRAARALGMQIAYYSRRRAPANIEASLDARYVPSLEDLAATSDVLSLHTPGGEETRHMVDARLLGLMKPTAILINTARGSVINEADLAQALKAGTIWAAGLDVYEQEPKVHPLLLTLDNAVLLPHLGSATIETRVAMGMRAATNVDLFFAGEPVRDRVA